MMMIHDDKIDLAAELFGIWKRNTGQEQVLFLPLRAMEPGPQKWWDGIADDVLVMLRGLDADEVRALCEEVEVRADSSVLRVIREHVGEKAEMALVPHEIMMRWGRAVQLCIDEIQDIKADPMAYTSDEVIGIIDRIRGILQDGK